MSNTSILRLLPFIVLGALPLSAQQDPAAAEARLREALRNTTLQLRDLQTEVDGLRIDNDRLTRESEELKKRIDQLIREAVAEQERNQKLRNDLQGALTTRERELERSRERINQVTAQWEQAMQAGRDLDEINRDLERNVALGERRIEDLLRRNHMLYRTGREVLDRYESFGLGTALTAREPFIGNTRVRIQNLVQDFRDALDDAMRDEESGALPEPDTGKSESKFELESETETESAAASTGDPSGETTEAPRSIRNPRRKNL